MSFILPFVEKAIAEAVKGNTHVCFHLESKTNPADWVQFKWDKVNLSYPFPHDPMETLSHLGLDAFENGLCEWEAMKFVTFKHGGSAKGTARFVEDYVCRIFGIADIKFEMKIEEQEL